MAPASRRPHLGARGDQQLKRWHLSAAKSQVALLLLKGPQPQGDRSAPQRPRGDRQQGTAIYRKAGLSGRRDLAAFFLEDLLSPQST